MLVKADQGSAHVKWRERERREGLKEDEGEVRVQMHLDRINSFLKFRILWSLLPRQSPPAEGWL